MIHTCASYAEVLARMTSAPMLKPQQLLQPVKLGGLLSEGLTLDREVGQNLITLPV